MEERGILSKQTCWEKRVDRGGFQVVGQHGYGGGFAGAGSPVPKGVPQLPRPAIIRLSGATISVNVPDSELEAQQAQGRLAFKVSRARQQHH